MEGLYWSKFLSAELPVVAIKQPEVVPTTPTDEFESNWPYVLVVCLSSSLPLSTNRSTEQPAAESTTC